MYDTFYWNDGLVFVAHHLLAGAAAWGGMYPGIGPTYAIFFMGVSEVSTTVLVILANFDDDMGVKGLAEAFPISRIVTAAAFVVAFLACRIGKRSERISISLRLCLTLSSLVLGSGLATLNPPAPP